MLSTSGSIRDNMSYGSDPDSSLDDSYILFSRSSHTRLFSLLLQNLIYKKEQLATVTFKPNGIKFTIEESHMMQGNAFLQETLFHEYSYKKNEEERVTINLSVFLDCLNIYGNTSSLPSVQIAYKGYGTPFLVMIEENDVVTDCALRTFEAENTTIYNIRSADIVSKIIIKSDSLREAFHELDWSNSTCTWLLSNEAPYFRLSTDSSDSSCQVDYPNDSQVFELFECSRTVEFGYKMKHLHPCIKTLSISKKTQIRVNSEGLLSMQHMICEDGNTTFVDFYFLPLEKLEDTEE